MDTVKVSAFAEKVYAAVSRIPSGRVATYGQIAELAGCPGGARAVGNVLHVNPFAPRDEFSAGAAAQPATAQPPRRVVPCHRVVAADGSIAAHFGCQGPHVQYARLAAEGVPFLPTAASLPRVDLARCGIVIEKHPLEPFLPANGRILFLGSFPPPRARWSIDFFYPNWINDFWRIQGLVHFGDVRRFEARGSVKQFDRAAIIEFCMRHGLAFFDTATKVCRWKGNASDEFLEIIEPSDVIGMLLKMPECHTVVTTGGKSSEELLSILRSSGSVKILHGQDRNGLATDDNGPSLITAPEVGSFVDIELAGRSVRWWRMPSSSRAYPMSLKTKAEQYSQLFR